MKTKPILTRSEAITQKAIDDALIGSAYRVFSMVRVNDVLEIEEGESVPSADRHFLLASHFDFVICQRQSGLAAFAVEFDGPLHDEPVQIRRDIQKNRLCMLTGLPLLRISYSEIEGNDRLTLIEFMVKRFIAWQQKRGQIIKEIEEYVADLPQDDVENLTQDGFLDPSIDPSFLFNIRHPFPGIERVAMRLISRFGIVTDYLPGKYVKKFNLGNEHLRMLCHGSSTVPSGHKVIKRRSYTVYRNNPNVKSLEWKSGKLVTPGVQVITEGSTDFGMQWTLPIAEDYDPSEVPAEYFIRTGKMPISFSDVPGVSIPDVAEWFSEYLALRQVEDFAISHELDSKSI